MAVKRQANLLLSGEWPISVYRPLCLLIFFDNDSKHWGSDISLSVVYMINIYKKYRIYSLNTQNSSYIYHLLTEDAQKGMT